MRRIFWLVAASAVVGVAAFVALSVFPQIGEKLFDVSCAQDAPDRECRTRMIAMGHTWSDKGDLDRAAVWYRRAAEAGEPAAMFHLAWTYQQMDSAEPNLGQPGRLESKFGPPGPTPNGAARLAVFKIEKAASWYRKAADNGFAPAMNNLGELYMQGALGPQNVQAATAWHLRAARAGNPVGAMNVSLAYRTGAGVAADRDEAQKWAVFVPASDSPDLDDMTLARTTLYGSLIDAKVRALIRNAAAKHEAVGLAYEPMKPAAGLPRFHAVTNDLNPAPREPTLRQLQR